MTADPDGPAAMGRRMRGTSVGDALAGATTALSAAGCETPRLDAEVLLADVLGVDRAQLLIGDDLELAGPRARAFQAAIRRRSAGREPVAYITGRRAFRRLELAVDRRALIPRPETEHLVEVGLTLAAGARVLDVGTGSGAVALALGDERPDLQVTGSDTSPVALLLARENARNLGLDISFIQADLLAGVPDEFDAIVSNPPYVPDGEWAGLQPEIVRHEPRQALVGGPAGLDVIARLVEQAAATSVRLLAMEVGAGQAGEVARLARAAGYPEVESVRDLAGIERVVVARRPC